MKLLDAEPTARRLAAAILADIVLNSAAGGDFAPEIAKGRELFRSRVAPDLHGLFETVLAESPLGDDPPAPAGALPPATTLVSGWLVLGAVLLLLLGIGAYVAILRR